ncbi:MAG: group 1 truncated hemoglobin [Bryobacteraceae bacterium]
MRNWKVRLTIAGLLAVCGAGAAEVGRTETLFVRLGGMPAVHAVVDDLWPRIVNDVRINKWFAEAAADPERAAAYRSKLASLLCQATGGPCQYSGDMVAAHAGRGITPEAFAAMASDIEATLEHLKVNAREKSEALALLGTLKPAVVSKDAAEGKR